MLWPKGRKRSEEEKQKMRESNIRTAQSPKAKAKRSEATKRNWQNPEYRKQQTERLKNKWKSDKDYREKMLEVQHNKKNSDETKERMSKARIKYYKEHPDSLFSLKPTSIELKVKEQLDMIGIRYIQQQRINDGKRNYFIDFYIPSLKLVLECNGDYWHNLPEKKERDKALKEYVESTGRRIIFIWEHEINDDWFWVGDYIEAQWKILST